MKRHHVAFVMAVAVATSGTAFGAQLAYDFETDAEGFASNGGLFPVAQDTIGATSGTGSLRVEVPAGAFFVGALTPLVAPSIADPPGVESVIFDLTIIDEYQGAFADIGVTIFGASQPGPGQQFGLQAQFADIAPLGVAPGTYEIKLDLDSATNPITFDQEQSFNEIIGGFGTGPFDLIPTGFQLYVSKSTDAPITFYIDNIRTNIPEPASAVLHT